MPSVPSRQWWEFQKGENEKGKNKNPVGGKQTWTLCLQAERLTRPGRLSQTPQPEAEDPGPTGAVAAQSALPVVILCLSPLVGSIALALPRCICIGP